MCVALQGDKKRGKCRCAERETKGLDGKGQKSRVAGRERAVDSPAGTGVKMRKKAFIAFNEAYLSTFWLDLGGFGGAGRGVIFF
jgi:hypothetical protein